jgi:hypothetical protein
MNDRSWLVHVVYCVACQCPNSWLNHREDSAYELCESRFSGSAQIGPSAL